MVFIIPVRKIVAATRRTMATVCETIQEAASHVCKPNCPCKLPTCTPECPCRTDSTSSNRTMAIFFNALGVLVAIIATYMIVSTDSKLYLVFWVCYSVLRRMMMKSRKHLKSD